jgi:hypothetical protein
MAMMCASSGSTLPSTWPSAVNAIAATALSGRRAGSPPACPGTCTITLLSIPPLQRQKTAPGRSLKNSVSDGSHPAFRKVRLMRR